MCPPRNPPPPFPTNPVSSSTVTHQNTLRRTFARHGASSPAVGVKGGVIKGGGQVCLNIDFICTLIRSLAMSDGIVEYVRQVSKLEDSHLRKLRRIFRLGPRTIRMLLAIRDELSLAHHALPVPTTVFHCHVQWMQRSSFNRLNQWSLDS